MARNEQHIDLKTVDAAALEHAYFANSYPVESEAVSSTVSAIKAVSALTVVLEGYLIARVGLAYSAYHNKLAAFNLQLGGGAHLLVPETAKIAAFIFVCLCAMKLLVGVFNYSHASCRTDRTVERVNSHNSLMLKVTCASLLVSGLFLWGLASHQGAFVQVSHVADSLKQSIYFQMVLQLVGHYLINRLHDKESGLDRIVDLKAHAAKL